MTDRNKQVIVAALIGGLIALAAIVVYMTTRDNNLQPRFGLSAPNATMNCENWGVQLTSNECFAAGTIRNVSLQNLQGAGQFCKWKAANPGEWNRLLNYAGTEAAPNPVIVTWFGGHIYNDLQAYFAAGGPTFTIQPNTALNICKTPLRPPTVTGVTPGQTDATVTVTTTP